MFKIEQTAGRDFAPEFAHFNNEILLGEIGTIKILI